MHPDIEEFIIIEVEDSALIEELCIPDNYELPEMIENLSGRELKSYGISRYTEWDEVPWRISLKICNQMAYEGIISPEFLSFGEVISITD